MAYTLESKEAMWFCQLLWDLGEEQLWVYYHSWDNQSAITLAENPKFHSHSSTLSSNFILYKPNFFLVKPSSNIALSENTNFVLWKLE
jgi:hypothetical protein